MVLEIEEKRPLSSWQSQIEAQKFLISSSLTETYQNCFSFCIGFGIWYTNGCRFSFVYGFLFCFLFCILVLILALYLCLACALWPCSAFFLSRSFICREFIIFFLFNTNFNFKIFFNVLITYNFVKLRPKSITIFVLGSNLNFCWKLTLIFPLCGSEWPECNEHIFKMMSYGPTAKLSFMASIACRPTVTLLGGCKFRGCLELRTRIT